MTNPGITSAGSLQVPIIVWYNSSTGEIQIWYMDGNTLASRATVVGQDGPALVGPPFSIVGVGKSLSALGTGPGGGGGTASLLASVRQNQQDGSIFELFIQGQNFGDSETVKATVDWQVTGEGSKYASRLLLANSLGYFSYWFNGNLPNGLCPITVPFGHPQPLQQFNVSAQGLTSNRTASMTLTFTCP